MKSVYMCFATDIIHSGHISIINKAAKLGEITVGILANDIVAIYDRYPLITLEERIEIFKGIKNVSHVVVQNELYYDNNLRNGKYDYVVHGDDWLNGELVDVRKKVIEVLNEWDGKLVEFPYTHNDTLSILEQEMKNRSGIPEVRRPKLRRMLATKKTLSFMEAHSGLSGIIVEKTKILKDNELKSFDGMWLSSLCDSTIKGKPDTELVDLTSRIKTVDEIMEVTSKPIIFDDDTGGQIEHFIYNIQTLERIGVSAVIIEDKIGLKKNSLLGTNAKQTQDSIVNFCDKISSGKSALKTKEFMLIARIESLILEQGMNDALNRAFSYVKAGADGIMIHSRKREPDEIFEFCDKFRELNKNTPLVIVPTTFNNVTEEEFSLHGINIIIHANQLIRSAYPAMQKTAESILEHGRSLEADEYCMPIKDVLSLIPGGL